MSFFTAVFLVAEMRAVFLGGVLVGVVFLLEEVFFPDIILVADFLELVFAEAVFFDKSFFF